MSNLALRDKTNQKFKDFFLKLFIMHEGQDFELAYSEIQRKTGAANVTMKRAIESLVEEGWFEVKPGRNSRYARFVLSAQEMARLFPEKAVQDTAEEVSPPALAPTVTQPASLEVQVLELESVVESLRRRLRTQEMAIAILQDRMAELEDKFLKR